MATDCRNGRRRCSRVRRREHVELHRAACWLSDIAWSEHPDYRAELAFTRSLRMPFAGISHADRVFVATVLHTRYGGAADDPVKEPTRQLLDERAAAEVRTLGLALRLAYTLCGGTIDLLSEVWLGREGDNLVLEIPPTGSLFRRRNGAAPPRRPCQIYGNERHGASVEKQRDGSGLVRPIAHNAPSLTARAGAFALELSNSHRMVRLSRLARWPQRRKTMG